MKFLRLSLFGSTGSAKCCKDCSPLFVVAILGGLFLGT